MLGICFGSLCRPRCHPRISLKWALKKEEVGEIDRLLSSIAKPLYQQINTNSPGRQGHLPALL